MAVPMLVQEEEEEDQEALVVDWMATALTVAANLRQIVATRVRAATSYAEAARAALQEAAALLQEAGDAGEILYADLLKVVALGADQVLYDAVDAAAKLVDSLFTGTGTAPFTGATIHAAGVLVASVFAFPPPVAGPLQDARRDLELLLQAHADAGYLFNLCAAELGLLPGADTWEFWVYHQEQATAQAREAEMRVNAAIWESIAAERTHRLYLAQPARPVEYMSEAEQTLRQAISEVDAALAAMRGLRSTVAAMELFVRDAIGEGEAP